MGPVQATIHTQIEDDPKKAKDDHADKRLEQHIENFGRRTLSTVEQNHHQGSNKENGREGNFCIGCIGKCAGEKIFLKCCKRDTELGHAPDHVGHAGGD